MWFIKIVEFLYQYTIFTHSDHLSSVFTDHSIVLSTCTYSSDHLFLHTTYSTYVQFTDHLFLRTAQAFRYVCTIHQPIIHAKLIQA